MKNVTRFLNGVKTPFGAGQQSEYHKVDFDRGVKVYYSDCVSKRELEASHLWQTVSDYYNSLLLMADTGLTPTAFEMGSVSLDLKSEFGQRCLTKFGQSSIDDFENIWTVYIVMSHIFNATKLTEAEPDEKRQKEITAELMAVIEKETGIKHRDPRPDNVLVQIIDSKPKFWVIDL